MVNEAALHWHQQWFDMLENTGIFQRPDDARGCQMSLVVCDPRLHARSILTKLEELNVTADWREPNVIRVAPVPLYNGFEDVYEFTERLRSAIDSHEQGQR